MARRTERKTVYVSVDLTPAARDALDLLAFAMTAELGRRVYRSAAALHAATLARTRMKAGAGECDEEDCACHPEPDGGENERG